MVTEAPDAERWHVAHFQFNLRGAWLEMIRQELSDEQFTKIDDTVLKRFEVAHAHISQQWRQNGGHAMLHHVNAMFGYDPVLVMPRCLELMPDYHLKMQF